MSSTRLSRLVTLLLLFSLVTLTLAASSSAFCKCTCFSNSTIIDLNGGSSNTGDTVVDGGDSSEKVERTCSDCTKKLCLEYHLPICKGAEEEDVFTQCFWRDSAKDQAVVFLFIFATAGLLGWAGVRPWVLKWTENMRERRTYIPLSGQNGR